MFASQKPFRNQAQSAVRWWCEPVESFTDRFVPPAEAIRVARFARQDDRARALAGAVLLRYAVSWASGVPAHQLEVARSCRRCGSHLHGKPEFPAAGVHSSMSHSGSVVAVAVATQPVGIDVEVVSAGSDGECRLDDWVRIESVLKATGDGMSVDPRDVHLTSEGSSWRVTAYAGIPLAARTLDLALKAGVTGALTVVGAENILISRGRMLDFDGFG